MQSPSRYILSRGLILTCLLLASCVALLLKARMPGTDYFQVMALADHLQSSALIVMGAGMIGSALMEDILWASEK